MNSKFLITISLTIQIPFVNKWDAMSQKLIYLDPSRRCANLIISIFSNHLHPNLPEVFRVNGDFGGYRNAKWMDSLPFCFGKDLQFGALICGLTIQSQCELDCAELVYTTTDGYLMWSKPLCSVYYIIKHVNIWYVNKASKGNRNGADERPSCTR